MAGLDPAIQYTIEMFSFFLDGRVKHGHDGEGFLTRFRFFHMLGGGIVTNAGVHCDPGWPHAASGTTMWLMLARMRLRGDGAVGNLRALNCRN